MKKINSTVAIKLKNVNKIVDNRSENINEKAIGIRTATQLELNQ